MLTDQEMLRYIYQNSQAVQNSINGILPYVTDPTLQKTLESQHRSHTALSNRAVVMLNKQGAPLPGSNHVSKIFSRVVSEMRAVTDTSPSHLAEMIISGSVSDMTKMQKHLNNYHAGDAHVRALAEEQVKSTQNNIEQMKPYLSYFS